MLNIFLGLLLVVCAQAQDSASDVIVLTSENFDAELAKHPLILVEFYAPWCGHCKHLAPEYEKAATELKKEGIPIAKVDAEAETQLAQRFSIRGYPTLKVFRNGVTTEYNGERVAAGIVSYMKKQALPAVSTLNNEEEVTKFSTQEKVVIIGFFENRDSTAYSNFKSTAEKLRDKFLFGEVIGNAALAKTFGADVLPSVVLFKKFDEGKNILSGEETLNGDITSFIAKNSIPLIDEVGPQNYKSYIDAGIPLVYLFVDLKVDGQLQDYMSRIRSQAEQTKGKLSWVYIDWQKYAKHAERLGLSGNTVPALAIEKIDEGTHYAYDESAEMSAENIGAWIQKYLSGELLPTIKSEEIPTDNSGPVKIVVAKNFDEIVLDSTKDVLLEFYAPWCGHCKQLAPIYDQLGTYFQNTPSVVIAKIDATNNDVNPKYGIRGFPTIKLFPANDKANPIDFDRDRTVDSFVQFMSEHASIKFDVESSKTKEEL